MGLQLINKSSLPLPSRGRGAVSTPQVSVRENGQIGFNNSAAKVLEGKTNAIIQWDADARQMVIIPVSLDKLPKSVKPENTFLVSQGKSVDKKGKAIIPTRYIGASELFKLDAVAYDYKSAGTHSFAAENGDGRLKFTLPVNGTLTPKPKKERKAKTASATAVGGTKVDMGSGTKVETTAPTTVNSSSVDEIEL